MITRVEISGLVRLTNRSKIPTMGSLLFFVFTLSFLKKIHRIAVQVGDEEFDTLVEDLTNAISSLGELTKSSPKRKAAAESKSKPKAKKAKK